MTRTTTILGLVYLSSIPPYPVFARSRIDDGHTATFTTHTHYFIDSLPASHRIMTARNSQHSHLTIASSTLLNRATAATLPNTAHPYQKLNNDLYHTIVLCVYLSCFFSSGLVHRVTSALRIYCTHYSTTWD